MEIFKGLPAKTITAQNKEGETEEFMVTTETVNQLITPILDGAEFSTDDDGFIQHIKDFDAEIRYALPDNIIQLSNDEIVKFINTYIDEHYQL